MHNKWLYDKWYLTYYQDNATPLFVASQGGHDDVVKTLLGAGADVNTTTSVVSDVMFSYGVVSSVC